jgi:hypothetical protein
MSHDECVDPVKIDHYFVGEVERVVALELESEDEVESNSTDEEDIDQKLEYFQQIMNNFHVVCKAARPCDLSDT